MKQAMALALSLVFVAGVQNAQAQQSASTAPKKTTRKRAVAKPDAVAAQLTELKQALDAQQQQIKQLSDQVQSRDQQIQQLQETLDASQTATTEAQSKAEAASSQAAAQQQTVTGLKSDVADLKSNTTNTAVALQETQKSLTEKVESPAALHYKGITITPGGFVAAETVWRQRATSSDINTPFTGIPYPGADLSKLSEANLTARQSRLSLLGESKVGATKLTGYWEADWLGTGVTSNNRQSNSYVMRQRVIYGQAAFKSGLSVSAGQMWSLVTENKKGIDNRTELPPLTIDSQYNVGFSWARQYGFRVVQNIHDKFAIGFAIEGPQATIGGRGFSSVVTSTSGITTATGGNTILNAAGSGGGLFNFADTTGYTINKSPDVIVKAAIDPGWGHYEVFGVFSAFRNRVYPCGVVGTNAKDTTSPPAALTQIQCFVDGSTTPSTLGAYNDTKIGGGGGVDFRLPIYKKKIELAGQGMAGDGVGRYGSAQIADLTFHPNGTEALIRTGHALGGLEWHSPKLDAYGYYGAEYGARTAYRGYETITVTKTPSIPATSTTSAIPATTTTTFSKPNVIGGYGSPFANNSGCASETLPSNNLTGQFPPPGAPFNPTAGSCAGDTRVVSEATLGFWYKFYNGPKGGFRLGLQYSYFTKTGWSGNNSSTGTSGAPGFAPKAVDNMIWTSIRYYIP